jgi:multiple sugar transport system permease protein
VRILRHILLLLVCLWSLVPIAVIVLFSVRPPRDIFAWPFPLWSRPTFENYIGLWQRWPEFRGQLFNSFVVTVGAATLTIVVATFAGYAYSRYRSTLLTLSAFWTILVRLFPPIVISLPLFPLANALGLNDTWAVLILLYSTFYISLGIWIMKATIDQIPRELDEAARVDGAGTFAILRHLVARLSTSGMVTTGLFVAVYAWNEFLFAYLFTTTRAVTAPLAVSEMIGSVESSDWGVLFAAATVQLMPVLAAVWFSQRYLIAGLTAGSIKG